MQRYVRLFGTPITLLVLIGILIFGARWGYKNVVAPAPPPPLVPCTNQNVGKALKVSQVTVKVYNGGTKAGLASTVAAQLRAVGFNVSKTGNTEVEVNQTQIIGADANNPEVKLVAGFFKNATRQGDGRVDHVVDVLLGDDFAGMATNPKTSIAVNGPVCLPPLPAAEASALATPSTSPSPKPSPTKS